MWLCKLSGNKITETMMGEVFKHRELFRWRSLRRNIVTDLILCLQSHLQQTDRMQTIGKVGQELRDPKFT